MERSVRWCVALMALLAHGRALADAVEASPQTGIKLAEKGRLHLALSASTGIDSNPNAAPYELILARTRGGEDAQLAGLGPSFHIPERFPHPNKILFTYPPDMFVAVRPSLSLNLPTTVAQVSLNSSLNFYEYLGLLQPGYPFLPGTEAYVKEMSILDYNSGYRRLRTIDGQMGGGLALNPKGAFGINLTGAAIRSVDPGPLIVGSRLARTNFNGGFGADFRPGGGTMTFSGKLGANAEIYDPQNATWFDGEPAPDFQEFDQFPRNLAGRGNPIDVMGLAPAANATVDPSKFHNAGLSMGAGWQWRFLPKSAVFVDAGIGSRFYLKFWDNPNATATFPISVMGGFMGQLTSKLGLVASLGLSYPVTLCFDAGTGFSLDRFGSNASCSANTGLLNGQTGGSDIDYLLGLAGLDVQTSQYLFWAPEMLRWQPIAAAPVGQLEARYQVLPTLTVMGGIRRQMRLVPLYRYLSDNAIYGGLTGLSFKRLQVSLQVRESFQPHGQLTDSTVAYNAFPFDEQLRAAVPMLKDADPGRFDNDVSFMSGLDVFILRWLIVGVSNTFNWHYSNARTGSPATATGTNGDPFNVSYVRNLTVARVELRY